jgi:hypothetical protein
MTVKPTVGELGIDTSVLDWHGSGEGAETIEVAFVAVRDEDWVLLRVTGEPSDLISVFSRYEWDCFLDGVKNGEFDDAAG